MAKVLEYKEYKGSIEFDLEDNCLFGKALFLDDAVIYQGETIAELKRCFEESIDEYLLTCEEIGKEPEKQFSGVFNVRMESSLHRSMAHRAVKLGVTLNALVSQACQWFLQHEYQPSVIHNHNHKHVQYIYRFTNESEGFSGSDYSISGVGYDRPRSQSESKKAAAAEH